MTSAPKSSASLAMPKPVCRYGQKCYRRNPQHFRDFQHPEDVSVKAGDNATSSISRVRPNIYGADRKRTKNDSNEDGINSSDDDDDALLEILSRPDQFDVGGMAKSQNSPGGNAGNASVTIAAQRARGPASRCSFEENICSNDTHVGPDVSSLVNESKRKRRSVVLETGFKRMNNSSNPVDHIFPSVSEKTVVCSSGVSYTQLKNNNCHSYCEGKTDAHAASTDKESTFSLFMTTVRGIDSRWNSSDRARSIRQILSERSADLRSSAQFNFMVDVPWLIDQYPTDCRDKPLLILTGDKSESLAQMRQSVADRKNIQFASARLDIPYGTHHTKMMLLRYSQSIRVVIHTANLIQGDWDQKSQAVWLSPFLPICEDSVTVGGKDRDNKSDKCISELKRSGSAGLMSNDSVTGFKTDLILYLRSYGLKCLGKLIETVEKTDFRSVRVFLIASTPGRFGLCEMNRWGHMKMRKILNSHSVCSSDSDAKLLTNKTSFSAKNSVFWPIVAQFSSIGSLGPTPESWLKSDFLTSLSAVSSVKIGLTPKPPIKLIFPSVDDVRLSLEGFPAGASIPYNNSTAVKQPYLRDFMHRWSAEACGRSHASPHIKTYARFSPDYTRLAWFCVTSANLSKAAWGAMEKQGMQLMIRSYELGVLFIPQFFNDNLDSLEVSSFPLPYDVPLTPYVVGDRPWILDLPYTEAPDTNGNIWYPR